MQLNVTISINQSIPYLLHNRTLLFPRVSFHLISSPLNSLAHPDAVTPSNQPMPPCSLARLALSSLVLPCSSSLSRIFWTRPVCVWERWSYFDRNYLTYHIYLVCLNLLDLSYLLDLLDLADLPYLPYLSYLLDLPYLSYLLRSEMSE